PEEPSPLSLDVQRFYDMSQRGWFSGDLHIHRAPDDMPLILRAEDLNIGPTITRHLGAPGREPAPFPQTHIVRADDTPFASLQNQEIERLGKGYGAVLLLNAPRPRVRGFERKAFHQQSPGEEARRVFQSFGRLVHLIRTNSSRPWSGRSCPTPPRSRH